MGTCDTRERCKTCDCSYSGGGKAADDCPGHFGHIEFGTPLYSYAFVARVVTLLRALCHN